MSDNRVELKPCPFCGEAEHIIRHPDEHVIMFCDRCEATGPRISFGRPMTPEANWNTRTLDPSIESLQAEVGRLREALEPFANCVEQISSDEDDEEWAKFRLLVKDYRRAASAMWPKRKGFARCPTCKGEFDDGEWEASSSCPECETPKAALTAKEQTRDR